MPQYDNSNTVFLMRNTRREKDTHAHWKGTYTDAQGVEHWADCWEGQTKNGQPYLKVSLGKPKSTPGAQGQPPPPRQSSMGYDPYDSGSQPPPQYPPAEPYLSSRDDQLVWCQPPGNQHPVQVTMQQARTMGWTLCPAPNHR